MLFWWFKIKTNVILGNAERPVAKPIHLTLVRLPLQQTWVCATGAEGKKRESNKTDCTFLRNRRERRGGKGRKPKQSSGKGLANLPPGFCWDVFTLNHPNQAKSNSHPCLCLGASDTSPGSSQLCCAQSSQTFRCLECAPENTCPSKAAQRQRQPGRCPPPEPRQPLPHLSSHHLALVLQPHSNHSSPSKA